MSRHRVLAVSVLALAGCVSTPPASQFPSAQAAIDRLRATSSCSRGIVGEAKLDYFGDSGRIRASTLYIASRPNRVRFDIVSPFGVTLSTFTSDGEAFAFSDFHEKVFFQGPASQCNISRFLRVPVPAPALVDLLSGAAPVLVHDPAHASITWESGAYVLRIDSLHRATERIEFVPRPEDWQLPWSQQSLRVLQVRVEQEGIELYRALFEGHRRVTTAAARVDPDGVEPDVPPSGPVCSAELPARIRFVVPASDQDLELLNQDEHHNPPLQRGTFDQVAAPGMTVRSASCADVVPSKNPSNTPAQVP